MTRLTPQYVIEHVCTYLGSVLVYYICPPLHPPINFVHNQLIVSKIIIVYLVLF